LQDNARAYAAQALADLFDGWGWEVLYPKDNIQNHWGLDFVDHPEF
jgi:hypothetical protein